MFGRFWAIPEGEKINQELFLKIKEQLWAEALAAFDAGEQWTLSEREREMLEEANRQFMVEDPLVAYLQEALAPWADDFMSTNKIMNDVLKGYREKVHPKALAAAMRSMGWEQGQHKDGSRVIRGYKRPQRQEDDEEAVW